MAKRTMTISRLYYHRFRKPDNRGHMSDLPDGTDLADMFQRFVTRIPPTSLVKRATENYSSIVGCERRGRAVIVTTKAGRFGEDGTIEDINTGEEVTQYGVDHATAVITHGVLLVPRVGESALGFVERSGGYGGMGPILELFVETFNSRFPEYRMKKETVTQTEAWLEYARLEKVVATTRNFSPDLADGAGRDEVLGEMRHVLVPPGRAKYFPRWLLPTLQDRNINHAPYLGLRDDTQADTIEVTLGDGEQSKTFEIGHDKTPSLRLILSQGGRAPTREFVIKSALDEAAGVFAHYGIEWAEGDALAQ